MKRLILCLFTLFITSAWSQEYDTYSLEIPADLARDIEEFSFKEFGELQDFSFSFISENDNLGHGLGAAAGLKAISDFEGDDLGKSFAIDLELLWKYENAELAVSFFSDLYSRFALSPDENGEIRHFNEDGKTRTENLSYEGIRASLKRDTNNKTYLSFEIEAAKIDDQNGIAIYIQNFFHYATKTWDNAQGGKQVQYEQVDYRGTKFLATGSAGIGKRYTLFDRKKVKVVGQSEVGLDLSTEKIFTTAYINTNIDLVLGRSSFKFTGEADLNRNYLYGASYNLDVINKKDLKLTMSLGVTREDKHFNDLFPDLYDHRFDSPTLKNNDLLFQYGFRVKFK